MPRRKKRQTPSTAEGKVRRIAPRPRNAPKPFDDGMQHFLVSVPRLNPTVDQAMREQVASTMEASAVPEPRFTDIEEVPVPLTPGLADVEASMQHLHAKLGIKPPYEDEAPAPDYDPWFEPIPPQDPPPAPTDNQAADRTERPHEESWPPAFVALFGYFACIAKGAATAIWLLAALIAAAPVFWTVG
jgi:hypothetical protein